MAEQRLKGGFLKSVISRLLIAVFCFASYSPAQAAQQSCENLVQFPLWKATSSTGVNHCNQFDGQNFMLHLLGELAAKLQYDFEEFCRHPRILDIFPEERLVYSHLDDEYHPRLFITLHYNEYSCEYQYDLDSESWAEQKCYSTF